MLLFIKLIEFSVDVVIFKLGISIEVTKSKPVIIWIIINITSKNPDVIL